MAILVIVWSILWDRMAILGLIDFKIGLYIEVNVNVGQNKLKSIYLTILPKWPSFGTK